MVGKILHIEKNLSGETNRVSAGCRAMKIVQFLPVFNLLSTNYFSHTAFRSTKYGTFLTTKGV